MTDETTRTDPPATRDVALVLAGLHLRLGSMSLARAELETLAAQGTLDQAARIDLAEVRWRTGDLTGAGAAASKALTSDETSVVAHVIAAEAASALGRPSEARRLAGRALAISVGPIDPVFAGMPRSGVWPADPSEPVPSPVTLFPTERVAAWSQGSGRPVVPAPDAPGGRLPDDHDAPPPDDGLAPAVPETGLWDIPDGVAAAAATAPAGLGAPVVSDGERLFEAARLALGSGDPATAAVRLGLVIRLAPELAADVVRLVGDSADPGLLLVSGDAHAAIGDDPAARAAYRAALAATAPAVGSSVAHDAPATDVMTATDVAAPAAEPESPAGHPEPTSDQPEPGDAEPIARPAGRRRRRRG